MTGASGFDGPPLNPFRENPLPHPTVGSGWAVTGCSFLQTAPHPPNGETHHEAKSGNPAALADKRRWQSQHAVSVPAGKSVHVPHNIESMVSPPFWIRKLLDVSIVTDSFFCARSHGKRQENHWILHLIPVKYSCSYKIFFIKNRLFQNILPLRERRSFSKCSG